MQASIETQPHFESHELVLWHILIDNRSRAIPGVVIAANDNERIATIKVRTIDGQTRVEMVAYDEIAIR
jgi:hypothetical protein